VSELPVLLDVVTTCECGHPVRCRSHAAADDALREHWQYTQAEPVDEDDEPDADSRRPS
jgi:hypothetical protein